MLELILLVVGFVLLLKGANFLVEGASSLSYRLRISEMVVGLTIVSFGTSAPELVFNVMASSMGKGDLAMGNIIGSNVANTLLVLGTAAVIRTIAIEKSTLTKDLTWNVVSVLLLMFVLLWRFAPSSLQGDATGGAWFSIANCSISRWEAIAFLVIFSGYFYQTIKNMRSEKAPPDSNKTKAKQDNIIQKSSTFKDICFIVIGITGLWLGGRWIVTGSLYLCELFGLSEGFVGFSVVAIGTSLPELTTSIVASRKNMLSLAVGNVLGSNLFNILFVLSITAIVKPLMVSSPMLWSVAFNLLIYILLLALILIYPKYSLSKIKGYSLLLLYLVYMGCLFFL